LGVIALASILLRQQKRHLGNRGGVSEYLSNSLAARNQRRHQVRTGCGYEKFMDGMVAG
jgi:hypothetical protein